MKRTPVRGARRGPSGLPPQQAVSQQADQAQLQAARRARIAHTYTGDFSLAVEIAEICHPLAHRVAARSNPMHFSESVNELIDAVHAAVKCVAINMIARSGAARRCANLPVEERGRAIRRLLADTPRPKRPQIAAKAIRSGSWALVCTELARPYSGPLSALLANAAPERRGSPTVSMQLEEALRVIDDAARALHNRLKASENSPAVARPPQIERQTQEQCRIARLGKLHFEWPPEWDLQAEICAICQPLAAQAAALPDPGRMAPEINALIDVTHESISEIAVLVAKADAAARSDHLPVDQRGFARRLILDLFQRPVRPVIADSDLARGQWADTLAELAAPYAAPLSQLLDTDARVGGVSVSDTLDRALKRIDSAALSLQRRIERLEASARSRPSPAVAAPAVTPADKARAELSRLGVTPP
jgi:hypothetical protein